MVMMMMMNLQNAIYDKLSPLTVKVEPKLIGYIRSKRKLAPLTPVIDQNANSTVVKQVSL